MTSLDLCDLAVVDVNVAERVKGKYQKSQHTAARVSPHYDPGHVYTTLHTQTAPATVAVCSHLSLCPEKLALPPLSTTCAAMSDMERMGFTKLPQRSIKLDNITRKQIIIHAN